MVRLLVRKLFLIVAAVPFLHWLGITYARNHPGFGAISYIRNNTIDTELTYTGYLQKVLMGDFGKVGIVPITEVLADPLKNSLVLIAISLFITAVLGLLLGFTAISFETQRTRPWSLILTTAGASIPGFLLGGIVISIIVYQTLYSGLAKTPIPISGYGLDSHLILPLLVLATRPTLHIAKVTAGLLENELQKNYVRAARGKGVRWFRLLWRHAFRNIIAPVLIVIGQSLRLIVGTLLIAEMMFLWPGIGRFFVYAVISNESFSAGTQFFAHPELIAALTVLMGLILLTADLLASLCAYLADPRLRESQVSD